MSDWETQKKALLPYLQRAAEIEAVDPKVAYYCRLYAVEQGIKLEQRDQKADDLLELVLNQLERDKPHLILDTSVDLEHCEKFALSVYIKAKRRDEQGVSDRDTAKAYYAAFNFIEILKQFGALSPEVEKERRFAVFRAAEIKRCLDEGRQPPPLVPPPEEEAGNGLQSAAALAKTDGGPPLIDYDPGYVIGSKILFMDGDSGLFRKGIIRGKAQEVGGFFNIQAEDASERQLGALFLAPDLSEGGDVTYFFPDGRQADCKVTDMNASEWPPVYTLQLEDGSAKSVNHSQFVLLSEPAPTEESTSPTGALGFPASPAAAPAQLSTDSGHPATDDPSRQMRKQTSWLVTRDNSRKINGTASNVGQGPSDTVVPGVPTIPPVNEDRATVPDPPPRYPSMQRKPLTVEDYYGDVDQQYYPTESPTVTGHPVSKSKSAKEQPAIVFERQPGFEPDAAAMQQAKKCAHNATAALNFSDVDHAIKCLQDALRCLTHPPSSSS